MRPRDGETETGERLRSGGVHRVAQNGRGALGRVFRGQARRADVTKTPLVRRGGIDPAGRGGKLQQQRVLPDEREQRLGEHRRGDRADDDIKPVERAGERVERQSLDALRLRPCALLTGARRGGDKSAGLLQLPGEQAGDAAVAEQQYVRAGKPRFRAQQRDRALGGETGDRDLIFLPAGVPRRGIPRRRNDHVGGGGVGDLVPVGEQQLSQRGEPGVRAGDGKAHNAPLLSKIVFQRMRAR